MGSEEGRSKVARPGVRTRRRVRLIHGLLPLASCLFWVSCGYQFQVEGPGPTIGGSTKPASSKPAPRLKVKVFENKAFEPNLEIKYTSYTRHEFSAGSGATVVPDGQPADMVLKGQILSVQLPALAFSQTATLENRVSVTVKAIVEDQRLGKVVWERVASASSEYFVTNDLQFNRVLQTRALEQAGRLIAEDLAMQFLSFLEAGPEPKKGTGGVQPPPVVPATETLDKGISGR